MAACKLLEQAPHGMQSGTFLSFFIFFFCIDFLPIKFLLFISNTW
jgi:hypothetical protein